MINTLSDYILHSLPGEGVLETNPNLRKKVDENGVFLPFYGNTVVFLLNDEVKRTLAAIQENLYRCAGDMLSEKLVPDTFHMTLHDLVNGPEENELLRREMVRAEKTAKAILARWWDWPDLHMKATATFNMVNTSIVLGLEPADGESWGQLDEMYSTLHQVVPLNYGLTPHITMAYFRPGLYDQSRLAALREALGKVELEVTLKMADLQLQNFRDMNRYFAG